MVIRVQVGRTRNGGSFAGWKKMRCLFIPQLPEQLWGPPASHSKRTGGSVHGGKAAGA